MTSLSLKLVALLTMTVDHIGYAFFPFDAGWRMVGRISFPLFAFLVAEGCRKTSSRKGYLLRLGLFALISEVPFDLFFRGSLFNPHYQNIFFTLLLGGLAVTVYETWGGYRALVGCLLCIGAASFLGTDYGGYGAALILLFYIAPTLPWAAAGYLALSLLYHSQALLVIIRGGRWDLLPGSCIQLWGLLAFVPLAFYNRQRGRELRWLFYWYYPAHLLILWLAYRLL